MYKNKKVLTEEIIERVTIGSSTSEKTKETKNKTFDRRSNLLNYALNNEKNTTTLENGDIEVKMLTNKSKNIYTIYTIKKEENNISTEALVADLF